MGQLRIELLGGFRVSVEGRAVADTAWRRRKPAALVKLLALAPAHRLHREQVMDALWPELGPEAAGANLRKSLHHARRALDALHPVGASLISSEADLLSLSTDHLWLDVETFRTALAAARRSGQVSEYRRALDLYRDGLLPDDLYEEWAVGPRRELHLEFLATLEDLAGLLEARGDLDGVPVHRAPAVVQESRLCVDGWIPVNPLTLETAFPSVYAVGDVTSVGTPKAGVFAEGQAVVVADEIIARHRGRPESETYDGHGICYVEFGHDQVGRVDVTFRSGERPSGEFEGPSQDYAADKSEFGSSRIRRWFGRDWSTW